MLRGSFLETQSRFIAGYAILGEIGGGGMGVVYAARNTRNSQYVALKLVSPQWLADSAEGKFVRERLFREALAANPLSNPSIVSIFEVG